MTGLFCSSVSRTLAYPHKFILLLLLFLFQVGQMQAQEISRRDWLISGTGLGFALGLEVLGKPHFAASDPRFTTPNSLDRSMRNKLWVGTKDQDLARTWSDRLIYGVGMSSLFWGPLSSDEPKLSLLINTRVFAANSILTNLVKISAARQRPYSYFETRESEGSKDYASFYSGHSSIAFSQAVTNAMLLSMTYPQYKGHIWSSLIGLAGLTAYLRVAGDMHYFSDVITGAILGSTIGWSITRYEMNRLGNKDVDASTSLEYGIAKSNFMISLKIPLG